MTPQDHDMTVKQRRERGPTWRQMVANPTAYARGRVTHPDHSTIHLQGWHRIQVNNEATLSGRLSGVVSDFLD